MEQQEQIPLSMVRQSAYQLLQQLFTFPEDDLVKLLLKGSLLELVQTITQQLQLEEEIVAEFIREVMEPLESVSDSSAAVLETLQIDYTRLFISAYPGAVVPPYARKHMTEGPGVQKEPEVFWQRAGVALTPQWRELPDHVAAEFGFMAWLIKRNATHEQAMDHQKELKQEYDSIEREFLQQHLSQWLPGFLRLVEQEAGTPFYRIMAKFAGAYIEYEISYFKQ